MHARVHAGRPRSSFDCGLVLVLILVPVLFLAVKENRFSGMDTVHVLRLLRGIACLLAWLGCCVYIRYIREASSCRRALVDCVCAVRV